MLKVYFSINFIFLLWYFYCLELLVSIKLNIFIGSRKKNDLIDTRIKSKINVWLESDLRIRMGVIFVYKINSLYIV